MREVEPDNHYYDDDDDDDDGVDSINVDTEDDGARSEDNSDRDNNAPRCSGYRRNAPSVNQQDSELDPLQLPIPLISNAAPPSQRTLDSFFQSPGQQYQRLPIQKPPPSQPLKRRATPTSPDLDTISPKRLRQHGTSKSSQFEAKSRAAADRGTYDPLQFRKFKTKILEVDPHAEFLIDGNPRIVRHSKCAGTIHMKATNNTSCFFKHLKRCKGPTKKRAPAANVDKGCLARFLNREMPASPANRVAPPSYPTLPCPGLTPERDERIWTYLVRSQAAGGGSRPRHVIAQELYKKTFGDLRSAQQMRVLRKEATEFRWINYREQRLILSASCLKESPSHQEPAEPCGECIAISKCRIFKNALNRDLPKQENLKFTPRIHRAETSSGQFAKMVGMHEIFQKATAVSYPWYFPIRYPQ